jgi:predicted RecA/RadA family phage recombinase
MKTYVQPGEVLTYTAPAGGVVSGTLYLIGALVVVATVDAAATEKFAAFVGPGVVMAPKATGAWTEGAKLYWDNTAKNVTTVLTANTLIGVAAQAQASGDTTGAVRLDGVAR